VSLKYDKKANIELGIARKWNDKKLLKV